MNILKSMVVVGILFTSVQSFAHHEEKNGPCSAYKTTCKADPTVTAATDKKAKWKAEEACVKAAATADTANGSACTAEIAKHHKH